MGFGLLQLLFLATLIASCGYALRFGGRTEKGGALLVIAASVLSWPAITVLGRNWQSPEVALILVDLAVLAGFLVLALRSRSFWPLWATGFHLVSVTTHIARVVQPAIVPIAYAAGEQLWAYPVIIALVLGTMHHRRQNAEHS